EPRSAIREIAEISVWTLFRLCWDASLLWCDCAAVGACARTSSPLPTNLRPLRYLHLPAAGIGEVGDAVHHHVVRPLAVAGRVADRPLGCTIAAVGDNRLAHELGLGAHVRLGLCAMLLGGHAG